MRTLRWLALTVGVGCGGASSSAVAPASAVTAASTESARSAEAAPSGAAAQVKSSARGGLSRSSVHAAVQQGLGAFLQHVELDGQPIRRAGQFFGFRIAALRDPAFWKDVDLRAGDIVSKVNGFPVERPEQAQTAFDSLEVASELRVAYERNGQARELVIPITDDL